MIKTRIFREFSLQSLLLLMGILITVYLLPTLLPTYRYSLIGFGSIMIIANFLMMMKKTNFLKLTRLVSIYFFISILIVFIVYYVSAFMILTDTYGMEKLFIKYGTAAKLLFLVICFAQPIILPIPEAITVGAGSTVFGPFQAASLAFAGTFSGILVLYFLARYGGTKIVTRFIKNSQLEQYQNDVRRNETLIMGLLFIVPVLPDEIICVGAGLSRISIKKFILIAGLSKLFTSFALAYSVTLAGYFQISNSQFIIYITGFLTIIFLVSYFIGKSRAGR
ncbi:TVP38/TMEM64 family protein [Bacillus salacetis]|uniref:TVP38/TMEM64 family protein n=1 Tax=Bacillus salacetis TaxID=2315464 RepID=UPI003B9FFDD9